jgi:hypothetical protein
MLQNTLRTWGTCGGIDWDLPEHVWELIRNKNNSPSPKQRNCTLWVHCWLTSLVARFFLIANILCNFWPWLMPVAETVGHSTKTDNTLCWFVFHFSTVWDYYVLGDVEDNFGLRSRETGTGTWKRRSIDERDKGGGWGWHVPYPKVNFMIQ